MIIVILVVLLITVLLYLFPIVQVCGNSMHPTYKDSEVILSTRIYRDHKVDIGDVFVYRPPSTSHDGVEYVIKRVRDVRESDGYLFFIGDNENNSYDSRNYGYVSRNRLVAKVIKARKRGE